MKRATFLASLLFALTLAPFARVSADQPPDPGKPRATYDVGSLTIDAYGDPAKPALVFIPALFCGPWEWNGEITRLSKHYSVYAIALPGLAGKPPIGDRSLLATATSDFWRFLSEKHVADAVVIGHSLGGTLALMLAEQHSDRIRAAVAVDGGLITSPGISADDPKLRDSEVDRIANSIAAIPPAQFGAALKDDILPRLMTKPSDVAAVAALGAKTDPAAAAEWLREALKADLRPKLRQVGVPFLEVMPFDPLSDPKADPRYATASDKQQVYESMLAPAPIAQVVTIVPSRHFIPYDQPDDLHAVLATFLASLGEMPAVPGSGSGGDEPKER